MSSCTESTRCIASKSTPPAPKMRAFFSFSALTAAAGLRQGLSFLEVERATGCFGALAPPPMSNSKTTPPRTGCPSAAVAGGRGKPSMVTGAIDLMCLAVGEWTGGSGFFVRISPDCLHGTSHTTKERTYIHVPKAGCEAVMGGCLVGARRLRLS